MALRELPELLCQAKAFVNVLRRDKVESDFRARLHQKTWQEGINISARNGTEYQELCGFIERHFRNAIPTLLLVFFMERVWRSETISQNQTDFYLEISNLVGASCRYEYNLSNMLLKCPCFDSWKLATVNHKFCSLHFLRCIKNLKWRRELKETAFSVIYY